MNKTRLPATAASFDSTVDLIVDLTDKIAKLPQMSSLMPH